MPDNPDSLERDYYPTSDIFVVAPAGYKEEEGLCTRCGHLYEPVCKSPTGKSLCWIDAHAGKYMEPSEDGFCLPPKEAAGCGTTGEPPCPADTVKEYGTVALVQQTEGATGWNISASIGLKEDGCLFSEHNLLLRFMKAPEGFLPEGHKCASVCIPCGIDGAPKCPYSGLGCVRRNSEINSRMFRDGPVLPDANGICTALRCGAATDIEDFRACGPQDPDVSAYDTNRDGCVEPYVLKDGVCMQPAQQPQEWPPLDAAEYHCAAPGHMYVDDDLIAHVEALSQDVRLNVTPEHLAAIKASKGKCAPCGRGHELNCLDMDFDGCFVQEGFIFDEAKGLCVPASCGGGLQDGRQGAWNRPWNASECSGALPHYEDSPENPSPLNKHTQCLYFHNRVANGGAGGDTCEPCGWPNQKCERECIYALEYVRDKDTPVTQRNGEFALRPDFRTGGALTGHCMTLPTVQVYGESCPLPKGKGKNGKDVRKRAAVGLALGALSLLMVATAAVLVIRRRTRLAHENYKFEGLDGSVSMNDPYEGPTKPASTYLDMAAASEAEALHNARNVESVEEPEEALPTSHFGIGKIA